MSDLLFWAELAFRGAAWGLVGTLLAAVGLVVTPAEGAPAEWANWKRFVNRTGALAIGWWVSALIFFWGVRT